MELGPGVEVTTAAGVGVPSVGRVPAAGGSSAKISVGVGEGAGAGPGSELTSPPQELVRRAMRRKTTALAEGYLHFALSSIIDLSCRPGLIDQSPDHHLTLGAGEKQESDALIPGRR